MVAPYAHQPLRNAALRSLLWPLPLAQVLNHGMTALLSRVLVRLRMSWRFE